MKHVYDPIHGFISLTDTMVKIIDTPEYQRLRDLKQLGAASYVFPSATHNRLSHSFGVCFLATEMITHLKTKQPELNITDRQIELVGIAGLVHDIGHGPFSHLYDNYVRKEDQPEHEDRGCEIFKQLVQKHDISLTSQEVDTIIKMVCPSREDGWLFQIVANVHNQIDVDKIDYIIRDCYYLGIACTAGDDFKRIIKECRVIDDIICYPLKVQYDIYALFAARYRLHKQVYNHHAVVSYEFLIIDILKEIMKDNPPFMDLTDSAVTCRLHSKHQKTQLSIDKRQHWRLAAEKCVDPKAEINTRELCKIIDKAHGCWKFHTHTIGFVSGNKSNPLNSVWFYNPKSKDCKIKLDLKKNSFIIPEKYQETIMRIYVRDEKDKLVAEEFLTKHVKI